MKIRRFLGLALILSALASSAMAQQTGGGTGGTTGGSTGGNTGGTTGGDTGGGGGGGGAALDGDTENTAAAKAVDQAMNSLTTDKVTNLRSSTLGRVGVVNNYGTGNLDANGQISTTSSGGAGPVGAGVHFRNAQGQSRYTASTSSTRGGATGATGGAGRTATGLGGAGGAQGLTNQFGGTGGLGAQGSTTTARIPLRMGEGLQRPLVTASSSSLVSSQIQSLPALGRAPQVQVQTAGRVVTLKGTVATQREKDQLTRTVKMRSGVDSVVNQIVVREQSSPSDQ